LTARHEVSDRVAGLDAGADDYLVKPFALDELLARLRALLRRASVTGGEEELRVGDLVLDPGRRQAWRGARELDLTKTEFDLLELLMFNAGRVLVRVTSFAARPTTSCCNEHRMAGYAMAWMISTTLRARHPVLMLRARSPNPMRTCS